jgi:hypothetical protein
MPRKIERLVPREVKTSETKQDKSRRLANQRFRILKAAMRRLGRLGGSAYELSPDQVNHLISLVTKEYNFLVTQFRANASANNDIFGE